MRTDTVARLRDGGEKPASELQRGDVVVVEAGELIPGDGTVIEGIASVDESAVTGESAPVIRESGGDRSAVTGGTRVLSDRIVVEITQEPGESFLDRMIALVEGAERRKTPNEIALGILLSGLTLDLPGRGRDAAAVRRVRRHRRSIATLIALLVSLIPTTIGALLSAIGIAGMDRLVRRNVLALSGRSVEASGDVDVLLLDKTGTITLGNREATEFIPMPGVQRGRPGRGGPAVLARRRDPRGPLDRRPGQAVRAARAALRPLSALRALLRRDAHERRRHRRHAAAQGRRRRDRRLRRADEGGHAPPELDASVDAIAREGGTPLAVARDNQVLGVIYLKDVVKEGMRHRFDQLRAMGIRTVMVTGDNPLTAAKIAEESGVDDFLAEATPEHKLELIRDEQREGRLVAMAGDGTNDAPALAQADVGVAMNTGTQAAREAGNMVDLDSNPTKLIEIVEIGKQLLITRGALTTFSVANDVAKYFAILPAIFAATYAAAGRRERAARQAQHHGSGHARVGDPLGDHLQRADHPAARAARAARRALPAGGRHRDAAPQPPDLRARRPDRAVRRHQAARPPDPQRAGRVASARWRPRTGGGRYKIFLGMAAGVGKTYRMLQEGHAARTDGPRRGHRLPRDARPRRDRRAGRGPRGRSRAGRSSTAGPSSRRWTFRPSSNARPSCA